MDKILNGIIKDLNGLYNDLIQAEKVFFDVTNQTKNTLKLIHAYKM